MSSLMFALYVNVVALSLLLGLQVLFRTSDHGLTYALSSLDEQRKPSVLADRIRRVKDNQLEAVVLLGAVLLAAQAGAADIKHAALISIAIIVGRAAYLIFALGGVAYLRSASWLVAFLAWAYFALSAVGSYF